MKTENWKKAIATLEITNVLLENSKWIFACIKIDFEEMAKIELIPHAFIAKFSSCIQILIAADKYIKKAILEHLKTLNWSLNSYH